MTEQRAVALSWQQILDSFEKDNNGMPIANKDMWDALALVKKNISFKECVNHSNLDQIRTHLHKWGYPTMPLYIAPAQPVIAIVWDFITTETK